MKLYLAYWTIPEIQPIPREQRAHIWSAFLKEHGMLSWQMWMAGLVFMVVFLSGFLLADLLDTMVPTAPIWLTSLPIVVLMIHGAFLCGHTYVVLMRKPFARFLAKQETGDPNANLPMAGEIQKATD